MSCPKFGRNTVQAQNLKISMIAASASAPKNFHRRANFMPVRHGRMLRVHLQIPPLVAIGALMLDFLCIHPKRSMSWAGTERAVAESGQLGNTQ
jgi:hypothetical protein